MCILVFPGSLPLFCPTAGKHDVPVVFREPHVEAGFRLLGQPWSYYIFSIFQLHNESLNIWTHLLAFALTAKKWLAFQLEVCNFTFYACVIDVYVHLGNCDICQ